MHTRGHFHVMSKANQIRPIVCKVGIFCSEKTVANTIRNYYAINCVPFVLALFTPSLVAEKIVIFNNHYCLGDIGKHVLIKKNYVKKKLVHYITCRFRRF
jgi:hypothetical protein